MNRTRVIALLLIAIIVLAGCTAAPTTTAATTAKSTTAAATAAPTTTQKLYFNATGYPIVDQAITIKIAGQMSAFTTTWVGNLQLKFLTKLTGINFDPVGYSADAWVAQKSLMFASNNLPDLFVNGNFTSAELLEYGSEGQLIALNKMVDKYGQAITQAFAKVPVSKAMSTSGDGNLYTLPRINQVVRDMHNRYWLNKKWLTTLGLKVPTTLNELYTVYKAFYDGDANGNGNAKDEIPVSGIKGGSSIDGLVLNALGINSKTPTYNLSATDDG